MSSWLRPLISNHNHFLPLKRMQFAFVTAGSLFVGRQHLAFTCISYRIGASCVHAPESVWRSVRSFLKCLSVGLISMNFSNPSITWLFFSCCEPVFSYIEKYLSIPPERHEGIYASQMIPALVITLGNRREVLSRKAWRGDGGGFKGYATMYIYNTIRISSWGEVQRVSFYFLYLWVRRDEVKIFTCMETLKVLCYRRRFLPKHQVQTQPPPHHPQLPRVSPRNM